MCNESYHNRTILCPPSQHDPMRCGHHIQMKKITLFVCGFHKKIVHFVSNGNKKMNLKVPLFYSRRFIFLVFFRFANFNYIILRFLRDFSCYFSFLLLGNKFCYNCCSCCYYCCSCFCCHCCCCERLLTQCSAF